MATTLPSGTAHCYSRVVITLTNVPSALQAASATATEWYSPFVTPAGALLGALIGGGIALISARLSDKRKQRADDVRQWDARLIEIYADMDAATLVFYSTWNLNDGDSRHLNQVIPDMEASIDAMGRGIAIIEIIAPNCESASRLLRDVAREALTNAENAIPMRGKHLETFKSAHAELVAAVQAQIRRTHQKKKTKKPLEKKA